MCSCYILYSQSLNRFYTGATRTSVEERLAKHNSNFYGDHHFTSIRSDWQLFLHIEVETYPHALRLEQKIKSMKSSKYIRNLKKYPELVQKITTETT